MIIMVPLAALMFFFPGSLVAIGTNHPDLIDLGSRYLRITAVLPVGIALVAGVGAGLNAMGRPHLNFAFTAVAVLSNIFLNWVLIFGNLGAPAMGIEGAALSTLVSVIIEVVFILVYLQLSGHILRVSPARIHRALARDAVKQFLRISLPLTIGGLVWHLGTFVYQAIYGHLGASELAVISMVQPVRTIMFAFFWGISSATGVIMGHHLGAGEFQHAWYRSLVLIGLGVTAAIAAVIVVWLGESSIFAAFSQMSPETIASARSVMFAVLLTTPILAANVVGIVGVLQSGADTRFVLVMDVFCQWAVGIPLCYLAAFHLELSLDFVFLAAFCEEIVKLFIWIPRFSSRIWIRRLVHELPA
jgi:putative MATE family efflux protein